MTIRKILCPTDCSEGSKPAIEYAHFIAKTFGAELHLLNVWSVHHQVRPDLFVWIESQGQQPIATYIEAEARTETDQFVKTLDTSIRAAVHVHVQEGEPWQSIIDTATKGDFDLIVMGTHGRTGVAHLALGSVAERVVRHSQCPVLTVRMKGD